MSNAVTLEVQDGLATMQLGREHGNAINAELVEGLIDCLHRAEADAGIRGVLFAASGKLFSPGLDLQELIELDRPAMEGFLDRFNTAVHALYGFPKPMVAAIQGHAVAGGCVMALTSDWRVLCEGAMIGLNEVRVGVPLPYGVAMLLRESVPAARLEEIALFGRNYSGEQAVQVGLAHESHPAEGFEEHCHERLAELADKDPQAFAVTKRYLRQATVARMEEDPHYAAEFLDRWFSAETRAKIRGIVEELHRKR